MSNDPIRKAFYDAIHTGGTHTAEVKPPWWAFWRKPRTVTISAKD